MYLFKDYEIRLKEGWVDISELDGKTVSIMPFTKNCNEQVLITKKYYKGKYKEMKNDYSEIEAIDDLIIINQFISDEINNNSLMMICFLTCDWKQEKCYFPHIVFERFNEEFKKRNIELNYNSSHYYGEGEFFNESQKIIIRDNCDFRIALNYLSNIPISSEKMKLIEPLILELNLPYIVNTNIIRYCGKYNIKKEKYYDGEVYEIEFNNNYYNIYARKKGQKFGAYFCKV